MVSEWEIQTLWFNWPMYTIDRWKLQYILCLWTIFIISIISLHIIVKVGGGNRITCIQEYYLVLFGVAQKK